MAWECTGKKKTCFLMLINLILVGIIFAIGFVVGYYVMKHKKEETASQKCNCKEPQHNVTRRTASSEVKFDGSETFQNKFVSSLNAKNLKEIIRNERRRRLESK